MDNETYLTRSRVPAVLIALVILIVLGSYAGLVIAAVVILALNDSTLEPQFEKANIQDTSAATSKSTHRMTGLPRLSQIPPCQSRRLVVYGLDRTHHNGRHFPGAKCAIQSIVPGKHARTPLHH